MANRSLHAWGTTGKQRSGFRIGSLPLIAVRGLSLHPQVCTTLRKHAETGRWEFTEAGLRLGNLDDKIEWPTRSTNHKNNNEKHNKGVPREGITKLALTLGTVSRMLRFAFSPITHRFVLLQIAQEAGKDTGPQLVVSRRVKRQRKVRILHRPNADDLTRLL